MGRYGTCALCGEEILEKESRDRHEQWVAWHLTRGRRGGGPNTKGKAPRATGAMAHGRCVEERHRKLKLGIPVKQGGLF